MKQSTLTMVRKISVTALLSSLTIVLGLTHAGLIPWFAGVSLTVMHVPAILAAILEGPLAGAVVGLCFGLTSMYQAAAFPTGILDPIFVNPLVSVLPRLLMGPLAYLVYMGLVLVIGPLLKPKAKPWAVSIASFSSAFVASLGHTAMVLFALKFFARAEKYSFLNAKFLWAIVIANGLPESLLASFICLAVGIAYLGLSGQLGKSRLARLEEGNK